MCHIPRQVMSQGGKVSLSFNPWAFQTDKTQDTERGVKTTQDKTRA